MITKQVLVYICIVYIYRIKEDFAAIELTLERLPSERFKRNVVHGKLDLVGKYSCTITLS